MRSQPITVHFTIQPRVLLTIASLFVPLLLLLAPAMSYSQADVRYFAETQHTIRGKFLQYWNDHGGLAQQGYPLTEEFQEKSKLNGQTYTVQYFERAIFELHPENQPPYDVLLSQLGKFELDSRYPNGSNPAAAPVQDPGATGNQKTATADIIDYDFQPKSLTIAVGATVTWTNQGQIIHTVADKDVTWSSDILNHGATYSHTFDKAGTYTIICTIHPEMTMTVIVQ